MFLEQNVLDIINIAREKGLENVEIRIIGNIVISDGDPDADGSPVELWVNGKERFLNESLAGIKKALEDHKDLKWMNK